MSPDTPADSNQDKKADDTPPEKPIRGGIPDEQPCADPAVKFIDALLSDLRASWQRGQRPSVRELLQQHPALLSRPETAAELIYLEYILRQEHGENPDRDAYLREYAAFAAPLQELFDAGYLVDEVLPRGQGSDDQPRRIGDYEIMEKIGEGGMGVVYRARQVSLGRIVAIKMIRSGQAPGKTDLARFGNEARAGATLHHPHIVAVHEVGDHLGRPFFSMDFVNGRSLAELLRENPLPADRAAGYVRTIALAIQHAHEHGILHRDLKPSNVLVDEADQPRVTDFGLAKRLEGDSELTLSGQVLGTPSYMPPEQANPKLGPITPASDVYALGAILYEALSARPPFKAENPLETLKQVLESEPVPLRLLNRMIPRDLETICLKCLQKQPNQRYASALELSQDLDRYLKHEPIRARPIGPVHRLARWCRRNPWVAGLAASVMLSLFIGTAVSVYFAVTAAESATRASANAARASANLDKAQAALDFIGIRVGQIGLPDVPQTESLRMEIAEFVLEEQESMLAENPDEPLFQWAAAKANLIVGQVRQYVGQSQKAEEAFHRALELCEQLAARHPDNSDYQKGIVEARANLGNLLVSVNRLQDAVTSYERVAEILAGLSEEDRKQPEHRRAQVGIDNNRAMRLLHSGQPRAAEALCRRAIVMARQLQEEFPGSKTDLENLTNLYNQLGITLKQQRKWKEAEDTYREAIKLQEGLASRFPASVSLQVHLGTYYRNFALYLRTIKRDHEAGKAYRKAMGIFENLVRDFPKAHQYHSELAASLLGLGLVSPSQEAEAFMKRAIEEQTTAIAIAPANVNYRREMRNHFGALCAVLVDLQKHKEASRAAIELAAHGDRSLDFYQAIRMLNFCVYLAMNDKSLLMNERKDLPQTYGAQAAEILRQGIQKKMVGPEVLKNLKDADEFEPLRNCEKIKTLFRELQDQGNRTGLQSRLGPFYRTGLPRSLRVQRVHS
jgi:tetratricopeptide (TPR) repeat protein